MRIALFILGVAALFLGECSLSEAQAKKKKKSPPAAQAEKRFTPELIELLTAASGDYELNGKAVATNIDAAAILRATQAKDSRIQELGRLACDLVSLQALVRKQTPDPEIERVAKTGKLELLADFLQVLAKRVSPEELAEFKGRAMLVDQLLKEGERKGVIEAGGLKPIEQKLFIGPQKQVIESTILKMVGQTRGFEMADKTRALVEGASRPVPAAKEPIAVKLETTKDKKVVLSLTNQTKAPLHHCLLFTRAVADPKKVEKFTRAEMTTRLGLVGALGASKENLESAATMIFLQSVLMNMDRGGMFFVPEVPVGGTVKVGLTSVKDMTYVKSTEVSLWSDELTVASLSAGTWAGFAPELAGVPLQLDKKGAAFIKAELTKTDPRDPKIPPTMRGKVCKVFTLPMTAGKTYVIETVADRSASRLNSPPTLRVEDEVGEVQTTIRDKTPTSSHRILFTPTAEGVYRIVCTEGFGQPGAFTLAVQAK
jgi:hypothetical protein